MKPAVRQRPSVRDKVDFFNDTATRAASSSRERPSRTPTRQTSEELMARTPPLSYAASSGQASSELDRLTRYDSDEESSDLRSVPSFPSLPSRGRKQYGSEYTSPSDAPPMPTHLTTVTSTFTNVASSIQPSPVSPSPRSPLGAVRDEEEDVPPIKLDRAAGLTLIANTPKGRCVKATKRIPVRTVIEVCPMLVLDPAEVQNHFAHTFLHNYTYNWPWKDERSGRTMQTQALPLGLGSLFNHSNHLWKCNVGWTRSVSGQHASITRPSTRNASYNMMDSFRAGTAAASTNADKDDRQVRGNDSITYTALRDIEEGEELCISYGPKERLTFVDAEAERDEAENEAEAVAHERVDSFAGRPLESPVAEEKTAQQTQPQLQSKKRNTAGVGGPTNGAPALENLWFDVTQLDIYKHIDDEVER